MWNSDNISISLINRILVAPCDQKFLDDGLVGMKFCILIITLLCALLNGCTSLKSYSEGLKDVSIYADKAYQSEAFVANLAV